MPRVKIELFVADADAVRKVKDFGRAVSDTWGTVKAGDPARRSSTEAEAAEADAPEADV